MKQCPKCGKTYDDSWKLCLEDQTLLEAFPASNQKFETVAKKKIGKVFLCCIGIAVVLALLFYIYAGLGILSQFMFDPSKARS